MPIDIRTDDYHTTFVERPFIAVGGTELVRINYTDCLASGATISTVTVAEQTTDDLTISGEAVANASYVETYTGDTVAANTAAMFLVSGGLANNSPYTILVTANTSESRTIPRELTLNWK